MSNAIIAQPVDFDLDLDCWTVTCSDGWPIYAASADEAEQRRQEHECIVQKHTQCNPGEVQPW